MKTPKNFYWDLFWSTVFIVYAFHLGMLLGLPAFILTRELVKILVSFTMGIEPLEFIAYGFDNAGISTTGTSNCIGYASFEKFEDVDAL
jgi:hypothetical protein